MRRSALSVPLALVLLGASIGPAIAIGTLDQSVSGGSGAACVPQVRAQTFTAGLTGNLDTVELQSAGFGNWGTTWNIEIRDVAAGLPIGGALATGAAQLVNGWSTFTLSQPVPVTAGQVYAIVSTTSPCWLWSSAEYPGGTAASHNGASWSAASGDLAFRTYVTTAAPTPVRIALVVGHGVAAAQAGPFSAGLTAPTGSSVWHQVSVTNSSDTALVGTTVAPLPSSCPALPSPFAIGAAYTCTYSAPMPAGTTADTVTAAFGPDTFAASVTLTGTGASTIGSKLGTPAAAGTYTAATKIASVGQYVTWRADLGATAANRVVGVEIATKAPDGTWGPFTRVTSRRADAAGEVTYSMLGTTPRWISIRFRDEGLTTNTGQARWR